jgi:hypothetical protein
MSSMDEQLLARLRDQEQHLREVADLLARAAAGVESLRGGDGGWRGVAADAFRGATENLHQQLADASLQLAHSVKNTILLAHHWGPHAR